MKLCKHGGLTRVGLWVLTAAAVGFFWIAPFIPLFLMAGRTR